MTDQRLQTCGFGFQEMVHSKVVLWCTVGSIASIALFNFSGIMVTKQLSGSSRATIDACRTAMVWAFSLLIGWEHFHLLQVAHCLKRAFVNLLVSAGAS